MCHEISQCRRLRKLGLSHAENITPIGLQSLAKLTNMEKLLLYHANNISSKDFRDFFNSAKLTKITVLSPGKKLLISLPTYLEVKCDPLWARQSIVRARSNFYGEPRAPMPI